MTGIIARIPVSNCRAAATLRAATLVVATTAVLLSGARETFARDFFVDNVIGSDRSNGLAPTVETDGRGPVRTLGHALRIADKSDRIILADTGQPYRESVTLQAGRNSGEPKFPFVIEGNGATLHGGVEIPSDAWTHHADDTFRIELTRGSFQQLFLDGAPIDRRRPTADGALPRLGPREWSLLGTHLYFAVEPDRLPADYALSRSSLEVGLGFYEVRHVIVRDLVIQGYRLDGVNAHDGAVDVTLVNVVSAGNGRSGASIGGASRVTIRQSRFFGNGDAQVRSEGYSRTQLIGCDLDEASAPAIDRAGGYVTVVE